MSEMLVATVRSAFPVTEVRFAGPLSVASAPIVRASVLKCLADQPSAILLDLDGVELVDDTAVLVFSALARHASDWPGCPIVLSVPSADLRAAFDRLAVSRYVEVYADQARAECATLAHPIPRRFTAQFLPIPESAGEARRLFTEACRRWNVPELINYGQVVVTELVANAVEHAGTMVDFKLSLRDRYLHVAVRDGNPAPPRRSEDVSDDAERGRGLLVVDAYTASWGHAPTLDGKVVWATLHAKPVGVGRTKLA